MTNVFIKSVEVLDNNHHILEIDPTTACYLINVEPTPIGITGKLYFRLICILIPKLSVQLKITARLINLADFRFTMGNGAQILYYREIQDSISFELPFELSNLKDAAICFPADVLISIDADNTASIHTRIKVI